MLYSPGNPPQSEFETKDIWRELNRIRDSMKSGQVEFVEFQTHNNEPQKPKNGRVYRADGVNWNPGKGQGLYVYEDGWVPLATTISTSRPGKAILTLVGIAPSIHFDVVNESIPNGTLTLTGFAPATSII